LPVFVAAVIIILVFCNRSAVWLGEVLGFSQVLASQRKRRSETSAVAGEISATWRLPSWCQFFLFKYSSALHYNFF